MRIVGIDPGYGRVGWAVIDGSRTRYSLIRVGCFETLKEKELSQRLMEVFEFVSELIERAKPDAVAVEELFFSKNVKTALDVSQARGAVLVAVARKGVESYSYNPMQIKTTVTGYGKAKKEQVQLMVKAQLKLKEIPKPDDAADACAVALTHLFINGGR